jgi:hypothetical protein
MTDETLAPAAISALSQTMTNPTPAVLAEDLLLLYELVQYVKNKLSGKHEGLMGLFWNLFNLPLETSKSDKV